MGDRAVFQVKDLFKTDVKTVCTHLKGLFI